MKAYISILVFWLCAATAQAATIYVDRDNACPGAGSTGDPYCAIQSAMTAAIAGDAIKIRDSAGAYTSGGTTPAGRDGTQTLPIIIEPDTGHNPTITSRIYIQDVSWWTVRNLTFDACSTTTIGGAALYATADTKDTTGIVFTGNTISCWGGTNQAGTGGAGRGGSDLSAITVRSRYTAPITWISATITNNVITTPIEKGIGITHGKNVIVQNNDISGVRCGVSSGYRNTIGVEIGGGTAGDSNNISKNKIYDFQDEATCYSFVSNRPEGYNTNGGGIYCDVGDNNSTVVGNEIYGIDFDNSALGQGRAAGIFWENRCNFAIIERNVIRDIKGVTGIGIDLAGNSSCTSSQGNTVRHNTIYNVTTKGLSMWNWGQNNKFQNNIIVTPNVAGYTTVAVGANAVTCGGHTINGNLYFRTGGGNPTWRWGNNATTSLATWRTQCGCDANSQQADPLLVSATNLSLAATSPALNAGVDLSLSFDGAGPDIGAYEVPVLPTDACIVGAVAANQIICNFSNNVAPPLVASDFSTGWTATKAGSANVITGATLTGQNQITFTTTGSYTNADSCTLSYNSATGSLTSSSPFTNKQKFFSITAFPCSNVVQEEPGDFPVVVTTSTSSFTTNVTTFPITLPSGIVSGNLLVCIVGLDNSSPPSALTWPNGWTELVPFGGSVGATSSEARYRVADGTEGSTVTVTFTSQYGERGGGACYRISGQHATTPPEGAAVTGDSINPNPPGLNPTGWGLENVLWITASISDGGAGSTTYSDDPDNYTDAIGFDNGNLDSGAELRSLRRSLAAESEDPGTFTITATTNKWRAMTIAIPPVAATTPTVTPSYRVTHFRFEAPDGAENSSKIRPTSSTTVNTETILVPDGVVRVRFGIKCENADCDSKSPLTYYALNGGAAAVIPTTAGADAIQAYGVSNVDSAIPSQGTVTTQQLTTGTFVAGSVIRTGDVPPAMDLAQNEVTEVVRFIQLVSATPGNRYCLYLYDQGGTPLDGAPAQACFTVINHAAAGL